MRFGIVGSAATAARNAFSARSKRPAFAGALAAAQQHASTRRPCPPARRRSDRRPPARRRRSRTRRRFSSAFARSPDALIRHRQRLAQARRRRRQLERLLEPVDGDADSRAWRARPWPRPASAAARAFGRCVEPLEQRLRLVEFALLQIDLARAPCSVGASSGCDRQHGLERFDRFRARGAASLYRWPSRYGQRLSFGASARAFA